MSRSPEVPSEALTIRTYAQLDAETAAFFGDHYKLFILIGRPGLGKTEAMLKYLALNPAKSHLITGKTTPLGAYKECYDYRHRLLIFNDAEVLWASDNGKTLMRALTEHHAEKMLQWLSSSKNLDHYPPSFKTTSKSVFVMNRFVSSNDPFYAAILDRGHLVYFDPPPAEIHQYCAKWFHDQEVFDFIAQHLHRVVGLTARAYNLTAEKKAAGLDWQQFFTTRFCDPGSKLWLVQKLVDDPKYPTVEDKIQEFIALEGGCKKTYYNYKAELEKNGQLRVAPPPQVECEGTAPPEVDRMALIADLEAAKAQPAPADSPKDDSTEKKSDGKKAAQSRRKKPAEPPATKTPLKVVAPEDDDLPEEPLDMPVKPPTKATKKSAKKKPAAKQKAGKKADVKRPKVQKPVRRKTTDRRPTGDKTKRRRPPQSDACTAADAIRIPHLLTHYTPAKCKV